MPIVTYSLVDGVAVIECISFGDTTAETISQALAQYDDLDRPILLDLRSNPGGSTNAAADSVGSFIGRHNITYFRDSDGKYTQVYSSSDYADRTDQPLIILTDGNSASASELFSAAIRDYRAGIAVGGRTYGKGIAQIVLDEESAPPFFDGDALKITSYRFFLPDGATNDTIGVLPTPHDLPRNMPPPRRCCSRPLSPRTARDTGSWNLPAVPSTSPGKQAAQEEYREAFDQLLEALPPPPSSARVPEAASGPPSPCSGRSGFWAELQLPLELHRSGAVRLCQRCGHPVRLWAAGRLPDSSFPAGAVHHPGRICCFAGLCPESASERLGRLYRRPSDAWYTKAVDAMVAKGFLAGRSSTSFAPQDSLTYEELVTILSAVSSWACMGPTLWPTSPFSPASRPPHHRALRRRKTVRRDRRRGAGAERESRSISTASSPWWTRPRPASI